MMKKLLIFALVLGMATFANAAIVISVNGDITKDTITILPSEIVTIDIWNTGGDVPVDFLSYLDFADPQNGNYYLSSPRLGSHAGNFPASFLGPYNMVTYEEVEMTQAWAVGTPEAAPGPIFLIDLHCEGPGDVTVTLWDGRVGYEAPVDTLIIHQIPEPATIALLGLGGLLLRRKK